MFVGRRGRVWPDRLTAGFMLISGTDFPRRFSDADFMIELSGRKHGSRRRRCRFVRMRMRVLFGVMMMVMMMLLKVGFVGGKLREKRGKRRRSKTGRKRSRKLVINHVIM